MIRQSTAALAAALLLGLGALAACGDDSDGSSSDSGPVQLRFQSLAWQTESLEVNQQLVDEWNQANPDIQVEYVQGDWGSVHDLLLTSFEAGDAPDIVHYEGAGIREFAKQGFLADLSDLLPDSLRGEIGQDSWDLVTVDEQVVGVPFLLESQVLIANQTMLADAGIDLPTIEAPWSWDDFQQHAATLTDGETYGAAWAVKSPTNRILNLALNFGGEFFYGDGDAVEVRVGDAERQVLQRIHDMIYVDETAAADAVGMSNSETLPGFFAGKYAMVPAPIWMRQQMVEQAPEDFEWVTLPPLAGSSQAQGTNPQTLSIPADAPHPEEAMQFIEFFLNPANMAALAHGDWMVPTGAQAGAELLDSTGGELGWDVAVSSVDAMTVAPFQLVDGFPEWKSRHAEPALQRYFANEITLDELAQELEEGGERVLR
jgi:ABC-type glycerol-3-phosphate transport system substrate-binding protein